jgi:hypothetical protein
VTGGGGGGGTSFGYLSLTRTSATVFTIGTECTSSAPCNVRFGNTTYQFTAPLTATISGSGTASLVPIYIAPGGTATIGASGAITVAGTGGLSNSTATAFPSGSIPLYMVSATSGNWGATWSNFEAFNSGTNINGTSGLIASQDASGNWNLSVDSTVFALLSALNTTATSTGTYPVLAMNAGAPQTATATAVAALFGCSGVLNSSGGCSSVGGTNVASFQNAITLTGTQTAAVSFPSVAIPANQCLDLSYWGSMTSSVSSFTLNLYIAGASVYQIIPSSSFVSGVSFAKGVDSNSYPIDIPTVKICSGTSANDIRISSLYTVVGTHTSNLLQTSNVEVTSNTVNLAAGATIALYVAGSGTMTLSASLK